MEKGGGGGGGAPTGCYKCGRPGHWSRDCPANPNPSNSDPNNNNQTNNPNNNNSYNNLKTANSYPFKKKSVATGVEKPKKVPRSRPKLTPDLLLSNEGLGYVLRHFPHAFKFRGAGHEVEQVGTTKRVKRCLRELREKIASGIDPAKLYETTVQLEISSHEQDAWDTPEQFPIEEIASLQNPNAGNLEENMINELWERAVEGPSQPPLDDLSGGAGGDEPAPSKPQSTSGAVMLSEEQLARIAANRLKALERAAARKQSSAR